MNRRLVTALWVVLCLLTAAVYGQQTRGGTASRGAKDNPLIGHLYSAYHVENILLSESGIPRYITGDLTPAGRFGDLTETSYAFFMDNSGLYRMTDPRAELKVVRTERDDIGMTHIEFAQYYRGVPVLHGEMKVHFGGDQLIKTVNGDYFDGIDLDVTPYLSPGAAEEQVVADLGTERSLCDFVGEPVLYVCRFEGKYYLVWHVEVGTRDDKGSWRYLVDAKNGGIVHRYTTTYNERTGGELRPVDGGSEGGATLEQMREIEQTPLVDTDEQAFLLNGQIWVRARGEYDFHLAETTTDIEGDIRQRQAELERLGRDVRYDLTLDLRNPQHLQAAENLGLNLIPMEPAGYFHAIVPKPMTRDLYNLGIDYTTYPDLPAEHSAFESEPPLKEERRGRHTLDTQLFWQDFEGVFPPTGWSCGDANSTNGSDYWDDVSCRFHGGGWSGWCAAIGQTQCVQYDDNMNAYMTPPAVYLGGRTNVMLSYWLWYLTESGWDYFRRYYSADGSYWVLSTHEYSGNSAGWLNKTATMTGFNDYYVKFVFFSDGSNCNYEGAYIDDIEFTGDLQECGHIGTGTGVMGNAQNHIDTDHDGTNYRLVDKTRRLNTTCSHSHSGQMTAGSDITTYNDTGVYPADPGTIFTNHYNAWTTAPGVDAHCFTAAFYDFLLSQFGRNSYNGAGGSMRATVDVNEAAYYQNAAYSGTYQRVGYGTVGTGWRSLAGCPDVVGHEWSHGVTDFESDLVYQMESGAMNESFSDIMGAVFGFLSGLDADWLMGENGRTNGTPFRDMVSPQTYSQPDFYGGTFWVSQVGCTPTSGNDYCGVHTNSGVPNRMFTLLAAGGTHHSVTVTAIGTANAASIIYRANANYWTSTSDMAAARAGCISAANDLNTSWTPQVENAWAAVGVGTAADVLNCSGAYALTNGTAYNSTTIGANSNIVDYSCTAWSETGPEKVHTFTLSQAATITATLSNLTVDLDVFLLGSCNDDNCLTYGDVSLTYPSLPAGTYYIVVDGYSGASGSYTLLYCITLVQATLSSPASGATVCSGAAQTYSWNSVYGATSYTIQWDDNSSFTSPEESSTSSTSWGHSLSGSGTWYWRVRATSGCQTGAWSGTRTIALTPVPVQASLSSPASGATVCSGVSQQYCWGAVSYATLYRIQWDDNSSFTSPDETTTASTCVNRTETGSGTWYWRARAENSCGSGTWANVRTIALTPVPAQATLSSPASGSTVCSDVTQTYCWNTVSWATSYRIQWDDNSSFSSPDEVSGWTNTCINRMESGSGTWYWRVRAENTCGNGNWSSNWTIALTPIPGQATLSSPAAGTVVCSGVSQQYCWNAVSWATTYRIQWDDNSGFTSPDETTTASTCINRTESGGGTWYWRARAENVCNIGNWSSSRTIALTPVPAQATLLSPSAGAVVCSGISQSYSWDVITYTTTYRVQWDDNSGFTSPDEVTTSSPSIIRTQNGSSTWYWRVRAENSCGNGNWSTTRSIALTATPAQASLSSPANGGTVCNAAAQQYCWNAVAQTTQYRAQWDDNSSFSSPEEATTAGTCINHGLSGTGTRYWRVRAENSCGIGSWSAWRTVNVIDPPGDASCVFPADGQDVCNGIPVDYVWNFVPGATMYVIWWDEDPDFSSPEEEYIEVTDRMHVFFGEGPRFWKVQALNSCGGGGWSATRWVILYAFPGPPSQISPPDGQEILSGAPQEYCWEDVSQAQDYVIQWDDDPNFGTPVEAIVTEACHTQILDGSGTWYWRVRSRNSCFTGDWVSGLTVELVSLSIPVVVIWWDEGLIRLAWPPASGATSYDVRYSDQQGGPYVFLTSTADTTITQSPDLAGRRFYEVVAKR